MSAPAKRAVEKVSDIPSKILGLLSPVAVEQVCDTCRAQTGFLTRRPEAKITCDPCYAERS